MSERVPSDLDAPSGPPASKTLRGAWNGEAFRARLIQALRIFVRFQSVLGLLIVFVAGVLITPRINGEIIFLRPANLGSLIQSISEYGILAVGMTFVIISGGIDLSVGRVLGLSAVVIARLMMVSGWDVVPAVLATLAIGLIFGLLQGYISVRLRLQAFIVTLAGMWIAYGIALTLLPNGQFIGITFGEGSNHAPAAFQVLGENLFGTIPVSAVIFLAVGLLGVLVLNTTRFGRQVYAVGGNERAARLSGISVTKVRCLVFGITGLLAALAGIVDAGQYNFGNPAQGYGFELMAIAAVVIGGTSLFGGRGSMVGTIAGVLMLGTINNVLLLNNIDSNIQKVITGLIIIAAAALQTVAGELTSVGGGTPARRAAGPKTQAAGPKTQAGS